jgi:hypothetical protein
MERQWIAVEPRDVAFGARLIDLLPANDNLTEFIERAVASGRQSDAIRPLILSFHCFGIQQARRDEALGAWRGALGWLSEDFYDDLRVLIDDLASELRALRSDIEARNSVGDAVVLHRGGQLEQGPFTE